MAWMEMHLFLPFAETGCSFFLPACVRRQVANEKAVTKQAGRQTDSKAGLWMEL